MSTHFLLILFIAFLAMTSCIKEPNREPFAGKVSKARGIYVLNEGLYGSNNSTISYYDSDKMVVVNDFFKSVNQRGLGDTGSDLGIYGTKMYAVVSTSSVLEVMEARTGKSIRQVPLFSGSKPRQPRQMAFYHGKVWVCSFDGTIAVIDTLVLAVENVIHAGKNPDGILATNGKIFVSNSGGLDFPNYDQTLSVIDPFTRTEINKIAVGLNPFTLQADSYGDLYVVSRGNYRDILSRLQIVSTADQKLKQTFDGFEASNIVISNDTAYVYSYDFAKSESTIMVLNTRTEEIITPRFISDGTVVETVYGIAVDAWNGDVYISDARSFLTTGRVHCYDRHGRRRFSFDTGLNPVKIVFVR